MKLVFSRALLASAMLVSAMLLATVGPASASGPASQGGPVSSDQPVSSNQLDAREWASIKAALDSSKLPKTTKLGNGARTTFYTLPSGSMLSMTERAGSRSEVTAEFSLGGCPGWFRLCVWLTPGDQLIVAAGSFAALTAVICMGGPAACAVAGIVAASTFQAISNRGYICPNYMVVEVLFNPGFVWSCY